MGFSRYRVLIICDTMYLGISNNVSKEHIAPICEKPEDGSSRFIQNIGMFPPQTYPTGS